MTRRTTAVLCLVLLEGIGLAGNWTQWRGPNNDGICAEKNLPTEWSETKNVVWKFALPGAGGSTPTVHDKHIFLTTQADKTLVLLCVGTDGKEKWRRDLGSATAVARSDEGNGASPSPSTDGKLVYVFVGNGTFAAFDFAGDEVWRFDAQKRYGKFRIAFGMHSTPALYKGRLYFQLIHDGGGQVICIDAKDGKEIWKVARKSDGTDENKHSYASAFVWNNGKDAYLVCHGNDYATAHQLSDGKEIWRLGGLNPRDTYNTTLRFVASPVCTPDLIVVPSAKEGPVVGLKPSARGMIHAGDEAEQWRMPRGTPDVPCPLVADGLVYLAGSGGGLTCLDAKTGKVYYARKPTHTHRHRASPVLADSKLYLTARDGVTTVVKPGKTFEKIATNKLPDEIAASPAIADGRIYLHGFKYLWAIGSR
jgi:outer membrane protein assembly factor BamB